MVETALAAQGFRQAAVAGLLLLVRTVNQVALVAMVVLVQHLR
jgi:hypothetical protein